MWFTDLDRTGMNWTEHKITSPACFWILYMVVLLESTGPILVSYKIRAM